MEGICLLLPSKSMQAHALTASIAVDTFVFFLDSGCCQCANNPGLSQRSERGLVWQKQPRPSSRSCTTRTLTLRGLLPIRCSSIRWLPSILRSSRHMSECSISPIKRRSELLKSSPTRRKRIQHQPCPWKISERIFPRCFGEQPSMLLLDQLVPFIHISPGGKSEKRRHRPVESNSPSAHQFRHARGTSQRPCMQGSGRSALPPPSSSKSGRGRVGVGSKSASLAENCLLMSRWEALHLFGGESTGGCIRLWRSTSGVPQRSSTKSPPTQQQLSAQSI